MTTVLDGHHWGWLAVGMAAQSCFFLRFFIQWIVSEARRESVIPVSFWYLSLAGCAGLLAYSLHKMDPVFIAGQSLGMCVYMRNLYFIHNKKAGPAGKDAGACVSRG